MNAGDAATATPFLDVPFSELTTMRVGGAADRMLVAETADELAQHARALFEGDEPWLLLGGGSNTVMSDDGFRGTVLLVRSEGIEVMPNEQVQQPQQNQSSNQRVRVRVQAGHDWDQLVAYCVEQGWAGIEALSGIPGSVGAAPVQNIGAYGAELSDVLHSIEFLHAESGEVVRLNAPELQLAYRTSTIKQGFEGVVLSIDLVLEVSQDQLSAPVRYAQLATALDVALGDRVGLRELRDAVLRLRASKGMVLDDGDYDTWSSGSFFTNPIVSESFARTLPHDAPRFEMSSDEDPRPVVVSFEDLERGLIPAAPAARAPRAVKLSAAWLIEQSGIKKGFRFPGSGAAISSKHTLAITNRGAASAADVAELARFVVQRVQQEFGIVLVPEPNLYGLEL